MEIAESVAPPKDFMHDATCPFCEGKDTFELRSYKTKHGALKQERALGKSLSMDGAIAEDPGSPGKPSIGKLFPLPGGAEPHHGWAAKPGVLEDVEVGIAATPHHIIPGNASMKKSRLETWTREAKGKIKEDIGYSIDCAQNGVWLPHKPELYTKKRFGRRWSEESDQQQHTVASLVMNETWLQMHYTNHSNAYIHVDNETTYDGEAEERCNLLGDLMTNFWSRKCEKSEDEDGKHYPPYGLVARINLQSDYMKLRITGRPDRWQSWVSPAAQEFTEDLMQRRLKLRRRFVIEPRAEA